VRALDVGSQWLPIKPAFMRIQCAGQLRLSGVTGGASLRRAVTWRRAAPFGLKLHDKLQHPADTVVSPPNQVSS
jgi:hypothetical protein